MAKVTQITSRRNPLLARLRKLADDGASYRRLGVVLLEGEHLCAAWLARPQAPVLHAIVSAAAWDEPRLRRLAEAAAEVAVVDAATLGQLGTLESPAPIAFLVPAPERAAIGAARADARPRPPPGSRATSAACCAAPRRSASRRRSRWSARRRSGRPRSFAPAWARTSACASSKAPTRRRWASSTFPCSAPARTPAQRLDEFALPWPCAWVFGHEGQGVAAASRARCRAMLAIPQPGGGESLNVAAAAAVCLYETARQHGR